ncbi:hypothetical protein GCM10011529_06800 [Polymorphobacter glacialis]|uniref:Autotransporter domain-containing protein n=1 Tax=Sandarakinorhabdus glacialis TaxID=1614636 RepID=A0A917E629_9SPHN|nr:DUF4394 domain-containing protein [Polymorphobacter glacialis]GGE02998.1 hypothetical protein GCM10011529_06800 [Polymorphobacter glacialis]
MKHFRLTFAATILAGSSLPALAADVTLVQSQQQGSALVTVDSAAPTTVKRTVQLTGLGVGERLIGFDARPAANRALYGLSNTGQVYAINGVTGTATRLGAPLPLSGFPANAGFDFNPSVDRIRIVTDADQNFRVNPDTGAIAAIDPNVAYTAGDRAAGSNPNIVGAAYTNNVAGGTPTVLYLIDSAAQTLVTQGSVNGAISPNSGQLLTVGSLGVATNEATAFDISSTGTTLALLTNPLTNVQGVYSINLTTGVATFVGALPVGANARFTGLSFTQTPFIAVGATANTQGVGNALDRFTGAPSGELVRLFGGFDSLPDDAARGAALGSLSAASFALLPELVFQSINNQDNVVRGYLRDVRAGGTGRSDMTTVGADRRIGMFLVAGGRTGSLAGDIDRNRTSYGAASVSAGADVRFTPGLLLGVFGGYDKGDARLNNASEQSDIDSWYAGVYGSAAIGPFFIDAHGSYGKTDFDLRRGVRVGSFSTINLAQTRSENWQAAGVAGLNFDLGKAQLEPYGGVRYARVDLDGFSETGGITALTVSGDRVESLQSVAGLKLAGNLPVGGSAVLRAHVRGEWRHEFENDEGRLIVANFNGASIASPFAFTTTPLGRDYAAIGAGFTVSGNSPVSLMIDYSGEVAGDRAIHGIMGGIRLAF